MKYARSRFGLPALAPCEVGLCRFEIDAERLREDSQMIPNHVARRRQFIRSALVEEGLPVRKRAGSGSRRPAR